MYDLNISPGQKWKKHGQETPTAPMPFAITSKKWKEYTQINDAEKKEKEDLILKRKAMRETKKQEKEKNKSHLSRKRKTIQTNVLPEQNGTHVTPSITKKKKTNSVETNASKLISDNSKEVAENEKYVLQAKGSNIMKKGIRKNKLTATSTYDVSTTVEYDYGQITIGSYVIVGYQKKYFPGIVTNTEDNEYEFEAMAPLSPNLFKWPVPENQICYNKNQIMETILPPILKKLGCYECQEISKYNFMLYL